MKQQENNERDGRARELAILQQQIRQCRLCQEQGYLAQAQPMVSGRAGDRMLVIGPRVERPRNVNRDRTKG